jgi:signal peptidase I
VTGAVDDEPPGDGQLPTVTESASLRMARNLAEWIGMVVGAVQVAVLIQAFVIQAFYIPSLSMYPTLDKGDRVLVNKVSYRLHDINRGDIVVFKRPPGVPTTGIKDLIKRVVGLPGDTVDGHDGGVYVNGRRLEESYLPRGTLTTDFPAKKVPKGDIFVMGDNRGNSEDSRVFGPIDEDLVIGRAFIRVWPLQHIDLL